MANWFGLDAGINEWEGGSTSSLVAIHEFARVLRITPRYTIVF